MQAGFSVLTAKLSTFLLLFATVTGIGTANAMDEVQMKNGDRYVGNVLSLNADTLVIQSELLGKLSLRRSQVSLVGLGLTNASLSSTNAATQGTPKNNAARGPKGAENTVQELNQSLKTASTNTAAQVHQDLLSQATPEASKKYYEMVRGLMTGKISVNDLRKEAKAVADQARALREDMGDEGTALDSYLSILDNFLRETAPTNSTNAPK